MTTIADLIHRLDHGASSLGDPVARADAHIAGWMMLAGRVQGVVDLLPFNGQLRVGLHNVLRPLANGPGSGVLAGTEPIPQLVDLTVTMGAISDILADTLRFRPRPEYGGSEAAKLAASLLAPVHLAARWSRAGVEKQAIPRERVSIRRRLADLAAVTEPWALIPPANRGSVLDDFRIRSPTAPGLEGVATAWADEALLVLTERHRVSGWAMQSTAGHLALISYTAFGAVQQAMKDGNLPESARDTAQVLAGSVKAWRAAATWPPHVRLGGKVTDLRVLTRDLHQQLAADPPKTVADTRNLLRLALPVGTAHINTMERLVRKHELWIHTSALSPLAESLVRGWVREPRWSHEGLPMLEAARTGKRALDWASFGLATEPGGTASRPLPMGWPPAPAGQIPLWSARESARTPSACRGPDR